MPEAAMLIGSGSLLIAVLPASSSEGLLGGCLLVVQLLLPAVPSSLQPAGRFSR
jgi:hypothetical protein